MARLQKLICLMFLIILMFGGWFLHPVRQEQAKAMAALDAKVSAIASGLSQSTLEQISEDEIRKLGGRLESRQIGNVLYFCSFTVPKNPNEKRKQVPIPVVDDVMTAIHKLALTLGPTQVAMAVAPEIGVYEGKMALMGVVVTTPPPTFAR